MARTLNINHHMKRRPRHHRRQNARFHCVSPPPTDPSPDQCDINAPPRLLDPRRTPHQDHLALPAPAERWTEAVEQDL